MKKLFLIGMLLTMVGNMLADNLSVADLQLTAGEEKQIAVDLTNIEHSYVAFQFDMILPQGVTVAKDNKGRFVANISEERNIDHTLNVGDVGQNTFRFLSYSGTNAAFYGTEGTLLYVTLKAEDTFSYGDFSAKIVDAKFTESNGAKFLLAETSFAISNPTPAAPITIRAKDVSRIYGNANPLFEYVVEGGEAMGEPELTCVATTTSSVGRYDIVVSRGSVTNENVTFVNGTLEVQKASLTITADNKQIIQGDAMPEFTASYEGFKNGETETVLTKNPEFQCSANSSSEPGVYDIVPVGAEAPNYTFSYVSGKLTIAARPIAEDDKLSVSDVDITAGGEKEIAISLVNPNRKYVAFQFDLQLPEGISVAKDDKGRFVAKLNEDRIIDHSLTVGEVGSNNGYRFLAYSGTNAELDDNNGAIVYVSLKADGNKQKGSYIASVVSPKFTVEDGTKYTLTDVAFGINVSGNPEPAITVTAKSTSRLYGDTNPKFEYTVSGGTLQGEPELSCVATSTSTVGLYDIVVSKGSITNGNVTFVNGTLTVNKAPLTVKADDKQMTQGDALPEFTASYEGFKNSETETVLTKKPEFLCSVTSNSDAGTYDIVPENAEAKNYELSYLKGTLTILPVTKEYVEISNPTAGELLNNIAAAGYQESQIEGMRVTGKLNGTDIKNIRSMLIDGQLIKLDMQDARIVAGGASYYLARYTENDIIGRKMFQDCKKLVSIKLPTTITYIDDSAFYGCSNLEAIEIPEGVTTIDMFAFRDCSSLSFMSIPSTLKQIDNNALKGCSSLTTVYSYIQDINEVSPYAYVKGKLKAFDILPDGSVWHVVEGKSDMYTNGENMWWNDTWQIIDDLPNTSGVASPLCSEKDSDTWYTFQGVRLSAKPTQQGVYVHNGCKVFVR